MTPAATYALAAALTLVLEVPVYVAWCRGLGWASLRRALAVAVAVNVATHPVLYAVTLHRGAPTLAVGEVLVVLVETALLCRWLPVRRDRWAALGAATLANAVSYVVGGTLLQVLGLLAG